MTVEQPLALDVLAIGAHPDDVEMGCGGTLIKLAEAGYAVGAADLTAAALSTRGNPELRRHETDAATALLGLKARFQLNLPESALMTTAGALERLVGLIRRTHPLLLLAPYPERRHPDHRDASELARRAAFWAGVKRFGDDQAPHRPRRIVYYHLHAVENVALVVDISSVFDRKMQAVLAYQSQFGESDDAPHTFVTRPGFVANLEARARYWGKMVGAEFGEPMWVPETPRVEDLVKWTSEQGVTG